MKYLISLAWKNILRYKRRTILTFVLLSVSMMMYIIMDGMFAGMDKMTMDNYVNFETGHFKILSERYDEDAPLSMSNFMKDPDSVMDKLRDKKYVSAMTKRVQFMAEADNGIDATPCVVTGIDKVTDSAVFTTTNFIMDGSFPQEEGVAVLGFELAKSLGLEVGSLFYLTFRNEQGMIDSVSFTVSGLINAPSPMVNSSGVYVSLQEALRLLNTDGATEITVMINDPEKYKDYLPDLTGTLAGYKIKNWKEMSKDVTSLMDTKKKFSYLFVMALLVIAVVGIVNTMLMSIFEKTKEIGMLKAIGMRDKDIERLFMIEGFLLGAIGGLFGILLGSLVNWNFVVNGIDFGSMVKGSEEMMNSLRMQDVLYSAWSIKTLLTSFILCAGLGTLASYYPARKATKMQAVECLRVI